jgi:hypothetical protein
MFKILMFLVLLIVSQSRFILDSHRSVEELSNFATPNANKKWTQSDDFILIKLYNDRHDIPSLAIIFGRSIKSIQFRLLHLNVYQY